MFKTFALTAALAVSAAFVGYNLDTVVKTAFDVRAYMQGAAPVDLKAAFWACYEHTGDASRCEAEAQAWAARDGVDAVNQIALGITDRMLANYPR
jgi:hypothetical protein